MTRKISVVLIFGGICFVFIFMGYNTFGPLGTGYAARVNNRVISILDFRNAAQRMQNFYANMFGGNYEMNNERLQQIRVSALDQLITQEATSQAAESEGLVAVPAEIRDTIVNVPAFQEDGKFQRTFYNNYLTSQRLTAAQFEERISRDIAFQRAQSFIASAVKPGLSEIKKEWEAQETKINVEFVTIDKVELSRKLKVDAKELNAFLSTDENIKVVNESYEVNKDRYTKPAQAKASHILIKFEKGNANSEKSALERINNIQKRVETEDFAAVARELSEDPGSKAKGGDLGFFSKGRMVPEFENYAFSGEIGKISEPIKTDYGYHLIKITERKESTTQPFEEVKEDLAREKVVEKRVEEQIAILTQALKEKNDPKVATVLKSLDIFWQETGEFNLATQRVPKVGNADNFLPAAATLTQPGQTYPELVYDGRKQYAVRLITRKNPNTEMPADQEAFTQKISSARSRDVFSKWSEQIVNSSRIEKNEALFR